MLKLIRFIGLLSQAIFLQFWHLSGFLGLAIAVAAGYFRLPSWTVAIMAVVFGVAVDRFGEISDVTGILEKAEHASQRGGFLVMVYFVIAAAGYVAGAYGRHHHEKLKAAGGAPAKK